MASTVWKGQLGFGLVSAPVKLSAAARSETIGFHQLRASDLSRVGQQLVAKADDKPVAREDIVKGYEVETDKYIVVTQAELDDIMPTSSKVMQIEEFVSESAVDPLRFDASYFIAPDKGGEKAYALLYRAMRESAKGAVVKIVMHQREHLGFIRSGKTGLCLYTLFYDDEVRAKDEFLTDKSLVSDKELALANKVLQHMSAKNFDSSKYRDEYRHSVLQLIDAKKNVVVQPKKKKAVKTAPAPDIMAALTASLEANKKKEAA